MWRPGASTLLDLEAATWTLSPSSSQFILVYKYSGTLSAQKSMLLLGKQIIIDREIPFVQSKEGTWRESVFGQWDFAINRCRDFLSWGEGPINHLSHTKHESGSNIFLW
jgi:hypothetical protein